MDSRYRNDFPGLSDVASKQTSPIDNRYNCIAWAFGDNSRHWWPRKRGSYWPRPVQGLTTREAFQDLLQDQGWEECNSSAHELGFEKIALYAQDEGITHAARMLPNGRWTSKLGQDIDLSHDLKELCGPTYGNVLALYRRKLK